MERYSRTALIGGLIAGSAVCSLFVIFDDGWGRTYNAGCLVTMLFVLFLLRMIRKAEEKEARKRAEREAEENSLGFRHYDDLSWLRYRDDGR